MKSGATTDVFLCTVSLIASQLAQGASSTWNLNPPSSDWNTAANWMPAVVPNNSNAAAIFDVSNTTKVTLSARVLVGEIIFNPGASAFTITAANNTTDALKIVGAGLNNQSGVEQALVAPEFGSFLGLPTVIFKGNALAGNLITLTASPRGGIRFQENSGADHAVIVGDRESAIVFADTSNAGSAAITASGTDRASSYGSVVAFIFNADAANAILIAEGGTGGGGGGTISFADDSSGGLAQVQIFGNGTLHVSHSGAGVTIGSLEGDGIVSLDAGALSIGSNGRNTVFSGVIQDFYIFQHSLIKIGDGVLHLKGASTYTGGTTIEGGTLLAENTTGSALGVDPVQVNSGILGGKGIIAAPVTIGDGTDADAFLAPGASSKHSTAALTLQDSLTFADFSNYTWKLNTLRPRADEVITFGGVSIGAGALFQARVIGNQTLSLGTSFTVIDNGAATPIAGQFTNLTDGSVITINGTRLQANYEGGDGNDLTLTVVP